MRMKRNQNRGRRILSLLLALIMCVSLLNISVLALDGTEDAQQLTCGLEETEGHSHTDECYAAQRVLTCEIPENHVHTVDCYALSEMGYEMEIDGQWYMVDGLTCTIPEGHVHGDECYAEEPVLTCGLDEAEAHHHTEACYAPVETEPETEPAEPEVTEPAEEQPEGDYGIMPISDGDTVKIYLYLKITGEYKTQFMNQYHNYSGYITVGYIEIPSSAVNNMPVTPSGPLGDKADDTYGVRQYVSDHRDKIQYFDDNNSLWSQPGVDKELVDWVNAQLMKSNGATDYVSDYATPCWHIDGTLEIKQTADVYVNYYNENGDVISAQYKEGPITYGYEYDVREQIFDTITTTDGKEYVLDHTNDVATSGKVAGLDVVINAYYREKTYPLTINKVVEGGPADAATTKGYTFTVTGPDGDHTATVTGSGKTSLNLKAGEYTVTEQDASIDGYDLDTTIPSEGKVTVTKDGQASITITNTYTQQLGSLTITKAVVGGGAAAASKVYTFTVTGPDNYSNTVTITGAGSETLENLVPGTYNVTEAGASIEGYSLEATVEGDATVTANGKATVTVTNTYTAKPENHTYTLNYDPNGGKFPFGGFMKEYSGVELTHTFTVDNGMKPTREGYVFMGWSLEKDGTTIAKEVEVTVTEPNKTVYAVWAEDTNGDGRDDTTETKYNVTYQWSGEVPDGAQLPQGETGVLSGTTVTVEPNPSASGYTFSGWNATYKDENGDVHTVTITDGTFEMPAADVTIIGSWSVPSNPGTPSTPDTPPVEDIPDDTPPLEDLPDIPDEDPPLSELPDEDVPTTDLPDLDIPDEQPPLAEIPDESVPMDETPRTGDDSRMGLWLSLMAGSGLGLIALGVQSRKRREEEQ